MATRSIQIEGPYTTAERNGLASPDLYQIIFNSTAGRFEFYTGSGWSAIPNDSPTFGTVTLDALSSLGSIYLFKNLIAADVAIHTTQGSDTAAANDLTLTTTGNVFQITGATQINAITTGSWERGVVVTLMFASTPTVKHNTAGGAGTLPILLAGAVDFVATAGDTLTLRYSTISGVHAWREISRAVI